MNASFDSDSVLKAMRSLLPEWSKNALIPQNAGAWIGKYSIKMNVILTRYGFCRTFNIVDPDKFLNVETCVIEKYFAENVVLS